MSTEVPMFDTDDGGTAYPTELIIRTVDQQGNLRGEERFGKPGMSVRRVYAGQIASGIAAGLSHVPAGMTPKLDLTAIATRSLLLADELLAVEAEIAARPTSSLDRREEASA